MIRVRVHPDARAFLARAEAWLGLNEMEHAMVLQSARFARAHDAQLRAQAGARPYWATLEDEDGVVGCAFRTPPYRLGITALPLTAIPALLESVGSIYAELSGVAGPEPAASEFAAAWTGLRGGSWAVRSRQRLLAHRLLVPTHDPPPGALRLGDGADAAVAHQWGGAFARESGLPGLDGSVCVSLIAARQLYFWDDGGPRCMLGVLRETKDAAAIGILYTPTPLRERGYATAAVEAFSRHLLERGLRDSYFCLEPSSTAGHSLCQRLGYAPVQDTSDIDFALA